MVVGDGFGIGVLVGNAIPWGMCVAVGSDDGVGIWVGNFVVVTAGKGVEVGIAARASCTAAAMVDCRSCVGSTVGVGDGVSVGWMVGVGAASAVA